jgi:hypothetical protein
MTDHLITPPPELVQKWMAEAMFSDSASFSVTQLRKEAGQYIANCAAQYGADQELEACCEVLARELICDGKHVATDLRMIRRPKPPSLKEQALETLQRIRKDGYPCNFQEDSDWDTIRRALEALLDD